MPPFNLILLTASRKCFGCSGPVSSHSFITSSAITHTHAHAQELTRYRSWWYNLRLHCGSSVCNMRTVIKQVLSSSWDGRLFGHDRHGPKTGGCAPFFFWGGLGPCLAQCGLGQGLPPHQTASWSIQPFGHKFTIDMGRKLGGRAPFFGKGELGPHVTQCGQGQGLSARHVSPWSTQPFGHNTPTILTDRTDRQRSDCIGQTALQTVAQNQTPVTFASNS